MFSFNFFLISLHSISNVEWDILQAKQNELEQTIGLPASKLSSNLTDHFSLQLLKHRDIIDLIYDRCSVLSKSIKLSLNLFSYWIASWIVSSILSSVVSGNLNKQLCLQQVKVESNWILFVTYIVIELNLFWKVN